MGYEVSLEPVPARLASSPPDISLLLTAQSLGSSRAAVPNLFGTRDRFHGRQFFHGQ